MKIGLIILLHNNKISIKDFAKALNISIENACKKLLGIKCFTVGDVGNFFNEYPSLRTTANYDDFTNEYDGLNFIITSDYAFNKFKSLLDMIKQQEEEKK